MCGMESEGGRTCGTGVRIATASVRTGLAMTLVFHEGAVCGGAHGPRPTRVFARIAGGQGRLSLRKAGRCEQARTGGVEPRPYGSVYKECDFYRAGRCGERTERCRWQRKRSERVAAVKIFSVRRKAAQKFWAPQQGHRPLRKRYKRCGEVRNPPVTASPCQPPLGKGAEGTRIATGALRPRNDTL